MDIRFLIVQSVSAVRICLAGIVWFSPDFLFVWLLAAAVSDVLDGWVARLLQQSSRFGEWFDPVCDKIFTASILLFFYLSGSITPLAITLLTLRESVFLVRLAIFQRPFPQKANLGGKLITGAQMLYFAAVIVDKTPPDIYLLFFIPLVFLTIYKIGENGKECNHT